MKAAIGADVVTIRMAKDERFETDQARALAAVAKAKGVRKATPFDQGVSVHATDGGSTLLDILRILDAEKVPVLEVALAHPTLDEVFLQHTGRQMRAEEVKTVNRGPWGRGRR